jgi:hypothetical protein
MSSASSLPGWVFALKDFRRQGDNPHELAVAQFARDWAKNAGASRVPLRVDQDGRVVVEPDV